jgi:hypothetical protein
MSEGKKLKLSSSWGDVMANRTPMAQKVLGDLALRTLPDIDELILHQQYLDRAKKMGGFPIHDYTSLEDMLKACIEGAEAGALAQSTNCKQAFPPQCPYAPGGILPSDIAMNSNPRGAAWFYGYWCINHPEKRNKQVIEESNEGVPEETTGKGGGTK